MQLKATKLGSIPESLTIIVRPETKVYWRWDDVEEGQIEQSVFPCFISDSSNKKTIETGKSWGGESHWDYHENKIVKRDFEIIELPNVPFSNLRIVTLEIRDKGGRAYKVCAQLGGKNLYFDMREDVLLDCMFQQGIQKGGLCEGPFIFARVGSQMKPVRVGSLLHDKMIEATQFDKKAKCDLELGGVYQNKKGDYFIYMGEYWTRDVTFDVKPDYFHAGGYYQGRNQFTDDCEHYQNQGWKYYWKVKALSKPYKVQVFHEAWQYKYPDCHKDIWWQSKDGINGIKKGELTAYHLYCVKKHTFKECVGIMDVPPGYIDLLKEKLAERKESWVSHAVELNISEDPNYVHPLFAKYL